MTRQAASGWADGDGLTRVMAAVVRGIVADLVEVVVEEIVGVVQAEKTVRDPGLRADLLERQALLLDELAVLDPQGRDEEMARFVALLRVQVRSLRWRSVVDDRNGLL